MIVIMKPGATRAEVEKVVKRIKKEGLDVNIDTGSEHVVIGVKGDTRTIQDVAFYSYDGVEKAVRISTTCANQLPGISPWGYGSRRGWRENR